MYLYSVIFDNSPIEHKEKIRNINKRVYKKNCI